jgi:hypothetical protein
MMASRGESQRYDKAVKGSEFNPGGKPRRAFSFVRILRRE